MKTVILNILFFVLFGVAFIGLAAEPDDTSAHWTAEFLISKGIAAAAGLGAYQIIRSSNRNAEDENNTELS